MNKKSTIKIYYRLITIFVVLNITLMMVSSASSQSTKAQNYFETYYDPDKPRLTITTNKGDTYHITVGSTKIFLIDEKDDTVIFTIDAIQYETTGFNDLILSPSGWLFIDGKEIDYILNIDTQQSPPLIEGEAIPLPELYESPCSYIERLSGFCLDNRSQGVYISILDRVLISGHKARLFGMPMFVTYQVTGKGKILIKKK